MLMEATLGISQVLDSYALDLIQGDLIAGAIIEFCRARALMRSHGLGVFQCTISLKICGNPGGAEDVTAELLLESRLGGPAAD
jgi:hypothetical protein